MIGKIKKVAVALGCAAAIAGGGGGKPKFMYT
jgi:hypothetical protein